MGPSRVRASSSSVQGGDSLRLPEVITTGRPRRRRSNAWSGVPGSMKPRVVLPGATSSATDSGPPRSRRTMGAAVLVSASRSSGASGEPVEPHDPAWLEDEDGTVRPSSLRNFDESARRSAWRLWRVDCYTAQRVDTPD